MRLLSVRLGATVLLLVVTLLIARASLSNPPTPAAAQGTVPTATATPDPTVVPTAPSDVHDAQDQLGGLFSQIEGDPPPSSDVETLASRLVGIDFGQLANAIESPVGPKDLVTGIPQTPHKLVLNLFADVVLTGIVEHVEPTSSGHALWGGLEGVKLGTMTLVVNGSVVVGTVRTPDAVYTIRTAGGGAYVVRQIDESSLPPLGEPLRGSIPEPDSPPPVRPQIRGSDAPDGTSTPTSTPTPVPTVATSPSKPAPDEAMASGLFSEVKGDPPPSPGVDTLASRLVEIDFGQLSQVTKSQVGPKDPVTGKPTEPQALVLNLFDDVVLTGIVEHVEPTSSGHSLWGRLDGVGLGTFTLVVNGRVVIGTVRMPDAVYTIRTAGDGTYVISQIDESSLPPLGEPLEPPLSPLSPLSPRDAPAEADDVPSDDGSEIDVMVVYTPLAKHREGGRAAIEALIDLFVAETNQAYAISGVTHRIKLVFREEVDYTEDGDSIIDLRRLRNGSDGHMDHVHERRDMYGADLVHIVVGKSDYSGRAYLNRRESSAEGERLGFGLTASFSGLVFAHELGHNMGLHHDRYEVGRRSAVGIIPLTGSHYGYVNQRMFEPGAPGSARWRTIMAYNKQCWEVAEYYCEWIGYFSNPENNYNGDPMGVPADHPSTGVDGPADAVKTLNDRREITANFRRSSASPTPRVHLTLSPYWLAENGGVSTVTATLHRPSSADTTVTILASPSDAVTLSGSRTLTIPAGRTVSADSVTITGVDNGDQTGDVSVAVSATATNPSSLGVIAPEPVELAIADDETTPVVTLSLSPAEIVENEGRTFVTATLDSRSSADTIVSVSAEPADAVEEISSYPLTIPAGQTENIGFGVWIQAVDNDELAEATQTVTVSGTSENAQGVAGPENVTLTIIDDEAPFFADDSIAYTFTAGIAGSRFLPEAEFGNGKLTYSLSPAPSNDVIFTPGPPARIGVSATSVAADATSYTLTATDADGDTDTMTVNITIREGVCLNSAAVSGYSDPGIVADCEALLSSRDILGGDNSLNWDEDLSIGEWQGVELADGRVVGINMTNLGLTGFIAGELGNLVKLQRLDLSINQLTGEIPAELGNLSYLESMDLSFNELTGEIPTELGRLANLERMLLYDNELDGGIPAELGNLSNLRALHLGDNRMTGGIPAELGRLANLERMLLYDNELTGDIPPDLGNLTNLRSFLLSGNELTGGIPTELSNLSNLRVLWLNHNQFTGNIPKELGNLPNLEQLLLEGNQLDGEIPAELGNLSNLEALWLGYNQLTGKIPAELGNLSNLRSLYLSGENQLTGCVPDGLRDVPKNDFLFLNLPFCSELACVNGGAVPDATNRGLVSDCGALLTARDVLAGTATLNWSADTPIADWSGLAVDGTPGRVTEILLGDMGLNGKIPKELGSLANLQTLDLSNNQLTGPIPTELGSFSDLEYLNLSDNQLTGPIPTELGSISSLQSLYLGENRLTLCVPDELRDVPNNDLASLGLPFCSEHPCVSGGAVTDATNTGLISDCVLLLAMRNTLAGTAILNWSAATPIADWSGVHVRGLPERVEGFLLRHRSLTGEIPIELSGLFNLDYLNLSSNQLTGEIPPELGNLKNLRQLYLSNNQFDGEIPKELGSLSELGRLDLSGNNFTGAIPVELGNLSILRTLRLGGNQLMSEIPVELGRLTYLTELTLNNNNLEGSIPASLESLWNLERLYLSNNRLTGCVPPRLQDVPDNDFARLGLPFCPLLPPEALSVGIATSEINSLAVSWAPPSSDGGSDITAYDLRHIETTADETVDSNWTVVEDVWTTGGGALEYTLTGLTAAIEYDIQVRAVNAEGDGPWSETVTGTPTSSDCVTEGAVTDATNTGLISDCEALLEGWDTLDGTGTLNWADTTPITQWDGVRLGGTPQRVTRLALPNKGLNGTVPESLGRLSRLTDLNLSTNELTGEIPDDLGNLFSLRVLNLRTNELTGEIPDDLGNLRNLKVLNLHSNNLRGGIPDLSRIAGLEELYLPNNADHDVDGTKVGGTGLTGQIPAWLNGMTNMRELWLWGNSLSGTVPDLSGMTSLDKLKLANNDLTGGVPEASTLPPNMTWLIIDRNPFGGTIPDLSSLTRLRLLWLHSNELTGEIPVGDMFPASLDDLNLRDNMLSGEIPDLSGLDKATRVRLHGNDLTGEIPATLGDLDSLQSLWLHGNILTGSIPKELGSLTNLQRLWLSDNNLSGQIPVELGDLSSHSLVQWRLSGEEHQFTGCLPAGLAAIADNDFDGLNLQVCTDS